MDIRKEADRMILGRFAPAAVLIDENLEILQFRGQTAPYLQPPSGQPTHNILKMVRDKLFLELRSVIDEARKQNTTARREKVRVQDGHGARLVSLEVIPVRLHGVAQRCFLVLFLEAGHPEAPIAATGESGLPTSTQAASADERENAELRQELASVKEYLQAIIEQQNAANEELQSANEEVRSANEELQSTNEELQTAKEELQSANEELRTVNDELQGRNEETSHVSDDLNNTLASIKLPMVMLGCDLRVRRFTPAAATLLNLIPTDLGRPFGDLGSVFNIPDLQIMLLDVIATAAVKEQEVQDRTGHWYLLALHPYRTADHRIDGVVLLLRDIDEDKRTKEQLKQANEAKDQFLAVLSHELRTPLTPVLATVSMLQEDDGLSADTRESLEIVRRNVELEARLIDDLLDATRIARGKVQLDRHPVELCTIIDRTVEVCKPDIEARKLEFEVDAQEGSCVVLGDASRLQQVFWNLLKNAVKFTPHEGRVGIRCRRMDGQAVVEVRDSGEGISPEVLPQLFKPFEQGGMRTTRQFGGLGLGLSISKALVEMHGGTITAQSQGKSHGSTFRVTLPMHVQPADAREAARSTEHPEARPVPRPLRIMLVEDHGDTARIMSRMLTRQGHEVQTAGDVASALRLTAEERFDLLISDLGLPDGSGHDLLRKLRASGQSLPAIALSGYGQQEDIQQSRAAGFAVHVIKPINAQQLYAAVHAVAGDSC
jgi:two-component system CheB/CheR fusion protein